MNGKHYNIIPIILTEMCVARIDPESFIEYAYDMTLMLL